MKRIYFREMIPPNRLKMFKKEFPYHQFTTIDLNKKKSLSEDEWSQIEILYSSTITPKELMMSKRLRWIHSPTPQLHNLCIKELTSRGNILITNRAEENKYQVGEFAAGALLALAKGQLEWFSKKEASCRSSFWKRLPASSNWTLKGKIFLQIGLERLGTTIAQQASNLQMKVWGIQPESSFHKYCYKTFSEKAIHSLLPQADVVSLSLPVKQRYNQWFGKKQFSLMKNGAIFMQIGGSSKQINLQALEDCVEKEKFKGVAVDTLKESDLKKNSPLWRSKITLLTPQIATFPENDNHLPLQVFSYNLRQYLYGNFSEMKNLVSASAVLD